MSTPLPCQTDSYVTIIWLRLRHILQEKYRAVCFLTCLQCKLQAETVMERTLWRQSRMLSDCKS